ncbi:APC family permease [Neorhodopirellula lusitana]|uniref:APC family permease n=1 Tax=Neorhodopirellula lusitana TaxID=445327 RepID=UPI00384AC96A
MKADVLKTQENSDEQIGLFGAVAIGVGGMVGGGIFAVLGLAAVLAGGATPIAFVVAGCVALITAYSYAKLSVAYPDNGGTIIFIDKAFGVDWFTGSCNMLLWLGYIVTLSLYTVAFANYSATFVPEPWQTPWMHHALITAGVVLPTLLNLFSAAIVSKTEIYIVGLKVAILVVIVALGFSSIDMQRIRPSDWPSSLSIVSAGMIIFVAYEGFELIANTSASVKDSRRTLPRAYYVSVLFVIVLYLLIAAIVVGALPSDEIASSQDFALAEAARPSLGQFGFTLVGITAVLATLSAINSTLYGAARLSYSIATEGELPKQLERKVWNQPVGLLITAGGALMLSNLADLSSISMMASASFLVIFALVNLANFVKWKATNSNRLIAMGGFLLCSAALLTLMGHVYQTEPSQLWVLVGLITIAAALEGGYILFLKPTGQVSRLEPQTVDAPNF